jgi:hypothetical protein
MKQYIYIGLLLLLTACTFNAGDNSKSSSFTTKRNGGIHENLRIEMMAKNDILISSIAANNVEELNKLSSNLLLGDNPEEFGGIIEMASELIQVEEYSVLSEYYTESTPSEIEISIESKTGNDKDTNAFNLKYSSPNRESYVSLLLSDAGHGVRMITAIYSKYESEWKIDYLHFSNFSLYGRTAPEYYYASEEAYIDDNLLGAFTLAMLSKSSVQPGGEIFSYEIQMDMDDYYEDILNEVGEEYPFPITLDQLSTHPDLIGISIIPMEGYQYIPMISYITKNDITNEDAIHDECDEFNAAIHQILPGFTWQFNQVLYQAFDKLPEDGVDVQNVTMLRPVPLIEPS